MAKFHISPKDGVPRRCSAKNACPLGENAEHFWSRDEARAAFEATMQSFSSTPGDFDEGVRLPVAAVGREETEGHMIYTRYSPSITRAAYFQKLATAPLAEIVKLKDEVDSARQRYFKNVYLVGQVYTDAEKAARKASVPQVTHDYHTSGEFLKEYSSALNELLSVQDPVSNTPPRAISKLNNAQENLRGLILFLEKKANKQAK